MKRIMCVAMSLLLCLCMLPLSGCSARKTATDEDIKRVCAQMGLECKEESSSTKTILAHYVFTDPNCVDFKLDYFIYSTTTKAQSQYLQKKIAFDNKQGERTEFQSAVFNKFTLSYSDTFNVIISQYDMMMCGVDLTTNGRLQAILDALEL